MHCALLFAKYNVDINDSKQVNFSIIIISVILTHGLCAKFHSDQLATS